MTRILVLSDTHLPDGEAMSSINGGNRDRATEFLSEIKGWARSADLILHAGDHTATAFHDALQHLGKVVAVRGNMDDAELRARLPEQIVLDLDGVRLGLMHGWGVRAGLPARVHAAWAAPRPDVIVFGHSHQTYQQDHQGTLLFNPGSPTRPFGARRTVGWLELDEGRRQPRIIALD